MLLSAPSSSSRLYKGFALGLLCIALAGCGIGKLDESGSATIAPPMSGKLYGGPNPIIGATIKMYATGNADGTNGGYGVATLLQEATQQGASAGQDTDSGGGFGFAGGYSCPAGQFAYIVGTGGNTGANAVNPYAVTVAALGRCEDLYNYDSANNVYTGWKAGTIYINELTTIAAAYSLGHFATVTNSGAGASTIVSIGAPDSNNAAQISGISTGCVANGSTCTTTQAAGLAHAFQNAANLVNVFSNTGLAVGANLNPITNSSVLVPNALINSIGNTLISCINSDGTATACTTIFTATKLNGVTPADTFSAMVNLAANPSLSGSGVTATQFLNVATAQNNVYFPYLSAAPNDYSIAVVYPTGLGAASTATATCPTAPCQGIAYPQSGALDINDVYYLGNQDVVSATMSNFLSFSSNGSLLGSTTTTSLYKKTYGISLDALGHLYAAHNVSGAPITRWSITGGVLSSTPTVITSPGTSPGSSNFTAVDRANNLWYSTSGTASNNVFMATSAATVSTGEYLAATFPQGIAIDPNQNVWFAGGTAAAANTVYVLQNTNTTDIGAPTYSSSSVQQATLTGRPAYGITFAPPLSSSASTTPYIAYVDFYNGTSSLPGIAAVTPTVTTTPTVASITAGTLYNSNITGAQYNAADGAGIIFSADSAGSKLVMSTPGTSSITNVALKPCLPNSQTGTTTTCTTIFSTPKNVAIDSAGSMWIPDGPKSEAIEIIGTATPAWPLLSVGKTGKP